MIPEIIIEYLDIRTGRLKVLRYDGVNVGVEKYVDKKEERLDIKEKKDSLYKEEYLYYLLVFLLGFLVAKIKLNTCKTEGSEEELFLQCIKETTSLEKLCFFW
ncbi:MAG: hypothetical protein SPLUMA1_SPLUMAMAG1_01570 [uncultured Sulfurimonas sp.]|nr:MAG: hypothetical protein SPLUMA1_SPLUMAMAG1_01570 [uncultured Sulfurimonas sp.]